MDMSRDAAQQVVPDDELDELIDGLRQPEKMISPKYFYDERGSQLFEEITQLPEYYPTETELGIMRDNIGEIAAAGADTFVAGSAIFGSEDYAATIAAMREEIAAAG